MPFTVSISAKFDVGMSPRSIQKLLRSTILLHHLYPPLLLLLICMCWFNFKRKQFL
ncbi:hypothetical protein Lalb_Chr21g0316791 [Lupinus albus]|uniref:Uncharacterized protein n=1 Tax=Lupinus albus TaxID=3870 RepID=A0A6A4NU84_LUPAL|nr:hypothetical protein Lalb_Chr21g0316791 [Lupinus albus]